MALRPSPDALREQAFAVLGARLAGASFLDLFAGTGVNSLEALSRGAAKVVMIERAGAAAALIRRNLDAIGAEPARFELLARDVRQVLPVLATRGACFEFAWCDPPFAEWTLGTAALHQALALGLLTPGAGIVLETPPRAQAHLPGFAVERELRGAVLLRV